MAFPVRVFSYQQEVFDGEVGSLSSKNELGPFDVLDLHANLISLLQEEVVLRDSQGTVMKQFALESGIIRCLNTQVHVYIVPKNEE